MKTPPFLMAAALVLWGWQTDFLYFAMAMAVSLEAARVLPWRWEAGLVEYNRVWDLCCLLAGGGVVYFYASDEITKTFAYAHWTPLFFYPIMLAQAWGHREQLEYRIFSWLIRRSKSAEWLGRGLNISYLYLALCLLSASSANISRGWYYFAFVGITGLMLWTQRPRRFSFPIWLLLLVLVARTGYSAQSNLFDLQRNLENVLANWVSKFVRRQPSARESRTAIGRIGKIKLSARIVWRVETTNNQAPPSLLREASFDEYRYNSGRRVATWYSNVRDDEYQGVSIDTDDSWTLKEGVAPRRTFTLSGYAGKGKTLLPMPPGPVRVRHLAALSVDYSRLGVVRADEAASLIVSPIDFGVAEQLDLGPGMVDFKVPESEQAALDRIVKELDLKGQPIELALERIARFFSSKFTYSLYLENAQSDATGENSPLAVFLERTHSGHCEYFATATVLLLRRAGFPARYATGYAVEEPGGRGFVVRERDAHAWSLVYRNGRWEDFDTTPASWAAIERERESWFQPVKDAWSRLWYEFTRWRHSEKSYQQYLFLLLAPLVAILLWRIVFGKNRRRRGRGGRAGDRDWDWPGIDSEIYQVERRLAALGLDRFPGETLIAWKDRVMMSGAVPIADLEPALSLHYRYRFDPHGLSAPERESLRFQVRRWLAELPRTVA